MKSVEEIREEFRSCPEGQWESLFTLYKDDERKSVAKILDQYRKKQEAYAREVARTKEMKHYEEMYAHLGYLCGIDEVGRGPLAGPVLACAVILPEDFDVLGIDDSKKLTAKKREQLFDQIMDKAVSVGMGLVEPARIDEINILQATFEAMREAVSELTVTPKLLMVDGVAIPGMSIPQLPLVHGDAKSISIAAASIVAKVTRDRIMDEYDRLFPQYDFASNKGYGTESHIQALKKYGPSTIHRASFIGHFVGEGEEI